MKLFSIEFQTQPFTPVVNNPKHQVINLAVHDLPMMIRQNLNLAIAPCVCGKVTKIKVEGTDTGPKTYVTWCCSDFQRVAYKFIPFIQ